MSEKRDDAPKMKDGLTKRGSRWWFVVRMTDPATGKRRPVWFGSFESEKEAKRARDTARQREHSGLGVAPSSLTVGAFVSEKWLPTVKCTLRPSTYALYESLARVHVLPALGAVRLQGLSGAELNRFYATLAAEGSEAGNGPLGAYALRHVHAVIHRALRDATRWHLVYRNVADDADPPSFDAERREMRTWSADELGRFLVAAEGLAIERQTVAERHRKGKPYPYRHTRPGDPMQVALWYTAALTGMRRGEVCGLRWSDVDLKAGSASIQRARVIVGGEVAVSPPKTARGRRVVALEGAVVAQLAHWKKLQAVQKLERGPKWSDRDGYVFTHDVALSNGDTHFGVPIRPDWMGTAFRVLVGEAGLPAIRLHDLRHTWATLAFQEKAHPKTVADQLGHANISVTLDIYSHAVPGLQAEAVGRVAKLALAKR